MVIQTSKTWDNDTDKAREPRGGREQLGGTAELGEAGQEKIGGVTGL